MVIFLMNKIPTQDQLHNELNTLRKECEELRHKFWNARESSKQAENRVNALSKEVRLCVQTTLTDVYGVHVDVSRETVDLLKNIAVCV